VARTAEVKTVQERAKKREDSMPLKISLIGARGKMGRILTEEIACQPVFSLVCAIESDSSEYIGTVVPFQNNSSLCFTRFSSAAVEACDVIIDFSVPASTHAVLAYVLQQGKPLQNKPLVCGVTNLTKETQEMMREAATLTPIFYAANMNPLVELMKQTLCQWARFIGGNWDVEIEERHHREKSDAPSGTAIALGEAIAAAQNKEPQTCFCFAHALHRNRPRAHGEIGFASLRGGSVFGQHTVHFLGQHDCLSVSHESFSRRGFAMGALRAAQWIVTQKEGLYGMESLTNHKDFVLY
jgi:4-hydroxy-tetrahydrodipicolinate reductase